MILFSGNFSSYMVLYEALNALSLWCFLAIKAWGVRPGRLPFTVSWVFLSTFFERPICMLSGLCTGRGLYAWLWFCFCDLRSAFRMVSLDLENFKFCVCSLPLFLSWIVFCFVLIFISMPFHMMMFEIDFWWSSMGSLLAWWLHLCGCLWTVFESFPW